MRALYWSAVINGIVSAPIMWVVMRLASRRAIMGDLCLKPALRIVGWLATLVMMLAALAMLYLQFFQFPAI
jgi:Mn2+/Fe2+ NRAMP family transporter